MLKEAETLLTGALKLNPQPALTHYQLGLLYERLGNMAGALTQFKKGISSYEQTRK